MGEIDPYQFRALTYAELAACEAVLGHREAAQLSLAHIDDVDPGGGLFTALLLRDRAWVYAADGETLRCAETLDAGAAHARKTGQTIIELLIHVDLARLLRRRFSAQDAHRLTIAEHHGSRLLVATAEAFSSRLPAECASVSRRLAAAGSNFLAGEAAIAASLRDPQYALLALQSCVDSERLWRTPIRVQALSGVDALTPREGELARLVAAGRTSAEVASLLGITVRTVDNQLGRVYRKLGLRGRRELES